MNSLKKVFLLILTFCITTTLFSQQSEVLDGKIENAVLTKSNKPVYSVNWSHDGKFFTSSWNNAVILWNAQMNTVAAVFSGHTSAVIESSFSKDDATFLTVSDDNSMIIRDVLNPSNSIKINGTSKQKIRDAIFINNGFEALLSYDGNELFEFFHLIATNQFILTPKIKTESQVSSLDIANDNKKALMYTQNGTIHIFESSQKDFLQTFTKMPNSSLKPKLSSDGNYFVASEDLNTISVTSLNEENTGEIIAKFSDKAEFVNTAIFSPDNSKIAVCLSDGTVKIYDIETQSLLKAYSVAMTHFDVVNTLAFSPDGNFLLAGTEQGYIIRWSLNSRVIIPLNQPYSDEDLMAIATIYDKNVVIPQEIEMQDGNVETSTTTEPNSIPKEESISEENPIPEKKEQTLIQIKKKDEEEKKVEIPLHQIPIDLGVSTIESNVFALSFFLQGGYNNFYFYPFYLGANLSFSATMPKKDYPYNYYVGKYKLPPPWLYSINLGANAGISYYIDKPKILCFVDVNMGLNAIVLCNNFIKAFYMSNPSFSYFGQLTLGAEWKGFRLTAGVKYDFGSKTMFNASLGYVIKLKKKKAS